MSKQTNLYTCRPVDENRTDGLWIYISPDGEQSSPCTRSYAQERCNEYNVLIRAGNTVTIYSEKCEVLKQTLNDLINVIESEWQVDKPQSVTDMIKQIKSNRSL